MAKIKATPERVIAVALSYVGYLEKKSNSQLDDFKANAGSGNYTKFARDLDAIPNFYNGKKQGFAWCDVSNDAWFVYAFGAEAAKKLLCQPWKSSGAGCKYSAEYYKAKGRFHTKNPKIGDQIFFWNSKKTGVAHTGLVYMVDNLYVYTVEGNTSPQSGVVANGGGVYKKKYALSYNRIYGYGRPDYDNVSYEVQEEEKNDFTVEMRMLKSGCKGEDVRALQILLSGRGYNGDMHTPDGIFGNNTLGAVKLYQKAKGLDVDGIAGPETMRKLLGIS